ncbi:hypothetical protein DTO027I6_277 [Penicillium roqueforti]|uniref:uncharacterized protein n=1 Tax=Penicillium roqueforti TaxID=5082 RepID=UPI00190E4730|nr:uncharacterized protein LCP9604111_3597 [Penicillium roqueforti]KAF9250081.1 hypothetical protein LCP9604111_3597 [Penicillium roqueforti]KAI2679532.1 hypothetical protein CBS147355_4014 [Penicillium roqueforti]KAI2717036.1 hypothetical protein CBS147318_5163 [Penicillium roqueforti]KAI3135243.1 hypothetical protein CBS147330_3295 [Penicillium roqueforti]KAI3158738.1 hypothetical protein CBS147317_4826 [Penicillium roqueforti]
MRAPVQSDTSRSTQSKRSIGTLYANQSPTSKSNCSSSGLTRAMSDVGVDVDTGDLNTPPVTIVGFSDFVASQPGVLEEQDKVDTSPLAGKRPPSTHGNKGSGVNKVSRDEMWQVITTTTKAAIGILHKTELEGTKFAYLANIFNAPVLGLKAPNLREYPNLTTVVRVEAGDTYDQALKIHNAGSTIDLMPVCVLSFANGEMPGGGWLNGARAQEEQLCYRSTLVYTLHPRFYPMQDHECVYSPNVIIFRDSADTGYSFMSADDKLHMNPTVSVVSMAARSRPQLTADQSTYKDVAQRYLMKAKMQLILRTAAHNNHRRLVLGALGCGAFRHPPQEVADCWKEVLMDGEFSGWFELIHFAIRDSNAENNLAIFTETLDGLNMG